ncbi:MAG: hypothetical protein ACO1N8_06410 [Methylophilus sp.]
MVQRTLGNLPYISLNSLSVDGFANHVEIDLEREGNLAQESECSIFVGFPVKFLLGEASKILSFEVSGDVNLVGGNFNIYMTDAINANFMYKFTQTTTPGVVTSVIAATTIEGSNASHIIELSNANGGVFNFSLQSGTADVGTDVSLTPILPVGFTLLNGLLTVPAGFRSFPILVVSNGDTTQEPDETYTLTVGDKSAIGTVINDDAAPIMAQVSTVSESTAVEGAQNTHTIQLTNGYGANNIQFSVVLSGDTASAEDILSVSFTNNVTLLNGLLNIPVGESTFDIVIGSVDDQLIEGTETYRISVGGIIAQGTITDNDEIVQSTSVVSSVYIASSLPELARHYWTVTLDAATTASQTFTFVSGGTAVEGVDFATIDDTKFTDGVTRVGNDINVPTGVITFSYAMDVNNLNADKTVSFTIGGHSSTTDSGVVTLQDLSPAVVSSVASPSISELSPISIAVELNKATLSAQVFPASIGGSAVLGVDYTSPPTFSNGVTYAPTGPTTGNLNVPIGVSIFNLLSNANNVVGDKTINVTVGGVTGIATIVDVSAVAVVALSPTVQEAPYALLTAPQKAAVGASGGYAMVTAENTNGANSDNYAIYSSTDGINYALALDNQPYNSYADLQGTISRDHRIVTLGNLNGITTSTANALGLIKDQDGQLEFVQIKNVASYTDFGDTSIIANLGVGALDSPPIEIRSYLEFKRLYLLNNYGVVNTLRSLTDTVYYKIVPKLGATELQTVANVAPQTITFAGRANKPLPPRFMTFTDWYGDPHTFPTTQEFNSGRCSIAIATADRTAEATSSSFWEPSGLTEATVTYWADVYVDGVLKRTIQFENMYGWAYTYFEWDRATDQLHGLTDYQFYSKRGAIESVRNIVSVDHGVTSGMPVQNVSTVVASMSGADLLIDVTMAAATTINQAVNIELLGTLVTDGAYTGAMTANNNVMPYMTHADLPIGTASFRLTIPTTAAGKTVSAKVGALDYSVITSNQVST